MRLAAYTLRTAGWHDSYLDCRSTKQRSPVVIGLPDGQTMFPLALADKEPKQKRPEMHPGSQRDCIMGVFLNSPIRALPM